ncbi:MAG TPA: Rieske 2Fe-2S domain-containing protein, partial [Clostridia bacterium]|nr:Rieske 2Fe-2S domain-containing protein [Clostridia bacterium]
YQWATQDCMTLDGIPYIGLYSKNTPDFYVATGFNKWGMTTSLAAAEILCDMVQGKENPYSLVFNPERTILHSQLALNALSNTKSYLTPTTKRCPHMGCALAFNAQEQSWDCSCHGSRFTKDGKLIDNPATGNLK